MNEALETRGLITLEVSTPIWENFFTVAPLVLVGTLEEDGTPDLAPKHMVTPLGWDNYVGFVCTPSHGTYRNARRTGEFTMSFLAPDHVVMASLASAPRCDGPDQKRPAMELLDVFDGVEVAAPLVGGSYLHLECRLHGIWDDFGRNSLVAGEVVAAHVAQESARSPARTDAELLYETPILAYLSPGRFAEIRETQAFPFHRGMRR